MHVVPLKSCRIFGSPSDDYEEYYLLGYNVMWSIESQPTLRRNISPPSSGLRISQARNQLESRRQADRTCFHASFLLGLFIDPEDGGDMFPQNVSCLAMDYTALHPRR
jgi:hypothetical protein